MKIRYYVCGIGYDKDNCVTDYEQYLGDFDTYEEAYNEFVMLQCRDTEWFFREAPSVYQLLLQLEECEEDDDETTCIDVHNEWWIINPNFKEDNNMLEKLIGRRYANLELLKNDIEVLTGKTVNAIIESVSERFDDTDFMIDFEIDDEIHTLFYLKDNGGNYYITEV